MVHSGLQNRRRSILAGLVVTLGLVAGMLVVAESPASAAVTGVSGGAYGYYTSVGLFGGPPDVDGPAPSVSLPSAGSTPLTATAPSGKAEAGPAVFFESGPITARTEGKTGPAGSSTSSVTITGTPDQPGPFRYDSIRTSCTASESGTTASTEIPGGYFETRYSFFSGDPSVLTPIPVDVAPNSEFSGVIDTVGDRWRAVVNEQIITSDSITVNAMHMYLLGETARGEMIIGQSRCGVSASSANAAPTAADDTYSVDSGPLTVPAPGVLGNDTDPDGTPLSAMMHNDPTEMTTIAPIPPGTVDGGIETPPKTVSYPANGTVELAADGSFTYTPNSGFSGTDTFTYVARDSRGANDVATATITVGSPSTGPPNDNFASAQSVSGGSGSVPGSNVDATVEEGEPPSSLGYSESSVWYEWTAPANSTVTFDTCDSTFGSAIDVYTGDSFATLVPVVGNAYNYSEACGREEGRQVVFNATGGTVYRIAVNGYNVCGRICSPSSGTMTLTWSSVLPLPPPPNDDFADAQAISGTSGSVLGTNVGATEETGEPDHGFFGDGAVSIWFDWTAPADGEFLFSACESRNDTYSRQLSTSVAAYTGDAVDALSLSSSTSPCDQGGGIISLGGPAGTVYHIAVDGNPNSYLDSDGDGRLDGPDVGRVVLDWWVVDETSPRAADDSYSTDEATPLTVAAPGVLGNDTDPNGDTVSAGSAGDPARGSVALNADGSFTYTPDAGFSGPDTFTYLVSDGNGGSDTGRVFIDVLPTDPVAVDDSYSTAGSYPGDAAAPFAVPAPGVLGNDTDPQGDPLSAGSASAPAYGTLTLDADGSFTYTPDPGFNGTDAFTYSVSDGNGGTDTATVTVTVDPPPNRNPVAVDDAYTTAEDTPLTVPAPGLLANDTDPDTNTLSAGYVSGGQTAGGRVVLTGNGSLTYFPNANFNGTDTFAYRANDGSGGSAEATVTFTVTAVNDVPVAGEDAVTTAAGAPVTVDAPGLLANDTDADGDALTAGSASTPANGTVSLNADGSFTYTPVGGFAGTDTFTYVASDGQGGSDTAVVTVTVNPPPDLGPPTMSVSDARPTFDVQEAVARFTVTRSSAAGVAAVKYKTSGGTATAGTDYTPVPLATLSFADGETSKAVEVGVVDDILPEADETFNLVLSAPTVGVLADASGTATILNGADGSVDLWISDVSVAEGNSGTATATFTVSRRNPVGESTVKYATKTGTADAGDFTPVPLSVLSFAAGEATKTVSVAVTGDTVAEVNERFSVVLSAPVGAKIIDSVGIATIVDDEGPIVPGPATYFRISNGLSYEGGPGQTPSGAFVTVYRSGDLSVASSVNVRTSGGNAVAGTDYTPLPLTTISFEPGLQLKNVPSVALIGDTVPGASKTLNFVLSGPTGAVISDAAGTVTILDDDEPAYLSVNNISFVERSSGTTTALFTVTRSGNTTGPATVKYKTGIGTATAGSDYTAVPLTSLSFGPGETSKWVSVAVTGDTSVEKNETFNLVLSASTGATISDANGLATILNDD